MSVFLPLLFCGLGIAVLCGVCVWLTVHALHHPKAPQVQQNKPVIACVGDSITFGAGVPLSHKTKSYPARLQRLVGDQYQVLNYGLSGRTLMKSGDQPYVKEAFYSITHELNADVYIIMLGTNDSKPENWKHAGPQGLQFEKELREFVQSYLSLPSHPAVVLMQPPRAFSNKFHISDDIICHEINGIIERVAVENHSKLINLYAFTMSHPEWFRDTIHPNAEGNLRLARYIHEQLF